MKTTINIEYTVVCWTDPNENVRLGFLYAGCFKKVGNFVMASLEMNKIAAGVLCAGLLYGSR